MNILQLCKKNPYPPKDGEAIAISTLTRGFYMANCHVELLTINTPKHNFDLNKLPDSFKKIANFNSVDVNTEIKISKAFFNLFNSKSYNVERFNSPKFSEKILELIRESDFDLILLEGLYLSPYVELIKSKTKAPIIMRAHNIEFEIWERLAEENTFLPKKLYLKFLAKRLKNLEIKMLPLYDMLMPISNKDEQYFRNLGYKGKSFVFPATVDLKDYPSKLNQLENNKNLKIGFIGSMDWMPNIEGLNWFFKEVWPILIEEFPNVEFLLAGRNIDPIWDKKEIPNLNVLGEVDNAQDFMRSLDVFIVPLFSGSGMRIKIIEAMALALPIVATTVAAEGIAYSNEKNIFISDTAGEQTQQLMALLISKELRNKVGLKAKEFISKNHDTNFLISEFLDQFNAAYPAIKVEK